VYASEVDVERHGEYRIVRDHRPLYRFAHRVTADGSSGFVAEPGRYHLYAGWFCPWSQRVTLEIALHGLEDVISVSYVDGGRDGRGWAFRERYGPDPVNGFTLLRDAYEATERGFDGHISVPTLWDRQSKQVVSNEFVGIGIDVAREFGAWSNGATTYAQSLREEIESFDRWIRPSVNEGVSRAAHDAAARKALLASFSRLETHLGRSWYLLGEQVTEADVRLWVTLARYDVRSNARGAIGPSLTEYPNLWAYARDLYQLPAFKRTTDFESFSAPGAWLPDWSEIPRRELTVA
jgi:glutathionyl-hydroquinone reductase